MRFIADAVGIRSGSCDKEVERLRSGITRAFCHNIEELSIRLSVQLIKNNSVNVETVLGVGFCR